MTINRRSRSVLALSLLLSGVALSSSVASAAGPDRRPVLPSGAVDITDTAKGRQLISEARARYAERGHEPGAMRAVKDASGIVIAPVDTTFDTYTVTLDDGSQATALAPVTADDPEPTDLNSVASELAVQAAPTWSFVSNHCYTRISDTWATLDHCYYKYKLANDGSGVYDWYALHRFGTASNNSPWVLDEAKIRAYRNSGSSQTWADWTPRTNWSGGSCSTISIGITSPVGGLSKSFERCPESVSFTKSANGTQPDYTQRWFGRRTRGNRELSFEIAVRIKHGGIASWALPAEVHGGPY